MKYLSINQLIHKLFLKRFYMDKTHPLNIPMQVHSLDVKKDIFRLQDDNDEFLGLEVPYILVQLVHLCIL